MRTNIARGVIVVFTAVMLSGCYSNGGWHMPGASSPFSSTQGASPGTAGTPVKPAGITAGGSTASTSGYPTAASNTTGPTVSQGVPANYNAPGTATRRPPIPIRRPPERRALPHQWPRPAMAERPTRPAGPAHPGYGSSPGTPAANGYGPASTAPASPYGNANPYSRRGGPVFLSPLRRPPIIQRLLRFAGSAAGGYGPSGASAGGYTNPARPSQGIRILKPPAPAAMAAALRTATAMRPAAPPLPTAPAADPAMEMRRRTRPVCREPRDRADQAIRLRQPAAAIRNRRPPATALRQPARAIRCRQPAAAIRNRQPPVTGSGNGIELSGAGSRSSYSQPPATSYGTPATGSGGSSYSAPAGSATSPAAGGSDLPAYRPGNTSDYVPQRPGATPSRRFLPRRQPIQALPRPATHRRPAASDCSSWRGRQECLPHREYRTVFGMTSRLLPSGTTTVYDKRQTLPDSPCGASRC